MNSYIKPGMKIVEVGCGSGFSQLYLEKPVILTDMILNTWVKKKKSMQ